jgi:hypothetical protein
MKPRKLLNLKLRPSKKVYRFTGIENLPARIKYLYFVKDKKHQFKFKKPKHQLCNL